MKKYLSLGFLVFLMMSLQACVTYVYGPGPGRVVVWHPYRPCCWTMETAPDSAALLAQNYGISAASAQKISDFAQDKDADAILDSMGVTSDDLAPLSDFEMPSQETIQTISANLGEEPAKIEKVFADFVAQTKAQQ